MFTNVTNYENNPDYKAVKQLIVDWRTGARTYQTIYIRKDEELNDVAIPQRSSGLNLDMAKIEAARAWSNKIKSDLGE